MDLNALPSEFLTVAATSNPQTINNGIVTTGAVDMSLYEGVIFFCSLGDMASEAIDFKLEQDTDSGMATAIKDVVAATQRGASASANDNIVIAIEIRASDLDLAGGFRYVRGNARTSGATGGDGNILALAYGARHAPGADIAGLVEVVSGA